MKSKTILFTCITLFICSCGTPSDNTVIHKSENDSLVLVQMVNERENAMKNKDIPAIMKQFSDDATFINAAGYYNANKKEIEFFHNNLTHMDSIGYYYKAGDVHVRILDSQNALVYYPWRMDWFQTSNIKDTIKKEIGLMTLSAQKRKDKWFWIAITNQHTPEYFEDLTKHKR